jgi:hypothetical protein
VNGFTDCDDSVRGARLFISQLYRGDMLKVVICRLQGKSLIHIRSMSECVGDCYTLRSCCNGGYRIISRSNAVKQMNSSANRARCAYSH